MTRATAVLSEVIANRAASLGLRFDRHHAIRQLETLRTSELVTAASLPDAALLHWWEDQASWAAEVVARMGERP